MPLPLIRYPLDPFGTNPDNTVVGEVHELHIRQIRAVAPTHGPFFTQGLVVYDNITNRLLTRGTDYQCVELLQEATVKYGKEIAQLILILDPLVGIEVRINYQVLGGLYQNTADGIVNMYETAMLDERPVDWINVLNKPYTYPPTLHNHLLQDVYGFEYLVVALERIRNAIILSDVPAFETLIAWVKGRTLDAVSYEEIDNVTPVNKIVTFEKLMYAIDKLNFNSIFLTPDKTVINNGELLTVKIDVSNMPDIAPLFWTIEHISTTDSDFNMLSGGIGITSYTGNINVSIASSAGEELAESFKVVVRKNSVDGPILTKSRVITIRSTSIFGPETGGGSGDTSDPYYVGGLSGSEDVVSYLATMSTYLNACCNYNPMVGITPESLFLIEDK